MGLSWPANVYGMNQREIARLNSIVKPTENMNPKLRDEIIIAQMSLHSRNSDHAALPGLRGSHDMFPADFNVRTASDPAGYVTSAGKNEPDNASNAGSSSSAGVPLVHPASDGQDQPLLLPRSSSDRATSERDSRQGSSNDYTIIKSDANEPFRFHASEDSYENQHIRNVRNLVSEDNDYPYPLPNVPADGTNMATYPSLHRSFSPGGGQPSPTNTLGSFPGSSGQGAVMPATNLNWPILSSEKIAALSSVVQKVTNAPAQVPVHGQTTAIQTLPPFPQEPIHIYRARTLPDNVPRGPAAFGMGRSHTGPAAQGYMGKMEQYGPPQAQGFAWSRPSNPLPSPMPRLNAAAAEFSHQPQGQVEQWNPSHLGKHVFLNPAQQVNWRHLLEPGVTADWNIIVERIIMGNDQQASIFLQQKIKNSEPQIKDAIIGSIVNRGLELMGNRFGNFLIQRVFECANDEQIMGLANHIRNHTVRLSTDAFGCHVVQKAFDCVPEDFKHQMVRELLTRIRDTIVHRYACHVWQKLFELRWQGPPPQIMDTVNAALIGQWPQVAVGETGSLVVQNIFENCNDHDKRPCINEVLNHLDYVARGQYGNWCIQHICEHGSVEDREVAISMILASAAEYSIDQYASKCIEKCLKVCGTEFLERYLQVVLTRAPGDNFSALVQIARDQYGNFLIQWILNNATVHLRDIVQAEIRKHIVSLRGNKYGSKVAMICGYGPQGVRPGVPFNNTYNPRGFVPQGPARQPFGGVPLPGHSANYSTDAQYDQLDGQGYYPPGRNNYNLGSNAGPYGNGSTPYGGTGENLYNQQAGPFDSNNPPVQPRNFNNSRGPYNNGGNGGYGGNHWNNQFQ